MPIQTLRDADKGDDESDYDRLPEPVKMIYTQQEYLWLSDAEKAVLIQQECEPEW